MTDQKPSPEDIFNQITKGNMIVQEASKSIAEFYKNIIPELEASAAKTIKNPPHSKEVETAIDNLTVSMIEQFNNKIKTLYGFDEEN